MKTDYIKDLIFSNKRLLKAIEQMPDEAKIDKWTKREILAHVAGWYQEGVDSLPKILKGEKPTSFKYSMNGFNKRSLEKRKNKNTSEILKEMNKLHKEFIDKVKNLTEDQIIGYFGTHLGKKQINVLWIINECITHDNNHAKEVEEKFKLS